MGAREFVSYAWLQSVRLLYTVQRVETADLVWHCAEPRHTDLPVPGSRVVDLWLAWRSELLRPGTKRDEPLINILDVCRGYLAML